MAITKLLPTSFFSVTCGQVCNRGSQERMFFLFSDILLYAKKSGSLDKDQRYERTHVLAYNLFVKRFFAHATKRTKRDSRKTIFFQLFAGGNLVPCIISNQKFQKRRKTCGEL